MNSTASENLETNFKNLKAKLKEISEHSIFFLLSYVALFSSFAGIVFKFLFPEKFISDPAVVIVFIFMLALTAISRIILTIAANKKDLPRELSLCLLWVFLFVAHSIDILFT